MKVTYKVLEEIIREEIISVLTEKKGIKHNCATHVKEISTGKLGEVISHSLTEDGSVEFYDVQFEDRLSENVPVTQLEVVDMVEHMHGAGKRDDKLKKHKGKYDDGDDKDEKCDHVPCKERLEEEGNKVTMHGCEFAKGLSKPDFIATGSKCKPSFRALWPGRYGAYKRKGG